MFIIISSIIVLKMPEMYDVAIIIHPLVTIYYLQEEI